MWAAAEPRLIAVALEVAAESFAVAAVALTLVFFKNFNLQRIGCIEG